MRLPTLFAGAALFTALSAPATAHVPPAEAPPQMTVPSSAQGAAAAVDAFHTALRRGDTRAAAALLADDTLVFEEGGAERSKAEYAVRHLPADAAFSQAVASGAVRRTGGSNGEFAWIATEGRMTGSFKGKPIDRVTTETMLLRRVGRDWKIVHIHWSSGAAS
jgi:ketosteroid isomerase-like protein